MVSLKEKKKLKAMAKFERLLRKRGENDETIRRLLYIALSFLDIYLNTKVKHGKPKRYK
jgi:hypothetical protein